MPHALFTSPLAQKPPSVQHPLAQFCGVQRWLCGWGHPDNTVTRLVIINHVFVDIVPPAGVPSDSTCSKGRDATDVSKGTRARRRTNKKAAGRPVRRAPLGARWDCCSQGDLHDGGPWGRTGLRTHRRGSFEPPTHRRFPGSVSAQCFVTAFVSVHRCGAALDSHQVPLTDACALTSASRSRAITM